jgi:hypothetical protein
MLMTCNRKLTIFGNYDITSTQYLVPITSSLGGCYHIILALHPKTNGCQKEPIILTWDFNPKGSGCWGVRYHIILGTCTPKLPSMGDKIPL